MWSELSMNNTFTPYVIGRGSFCDGCIYYEICGNQKHKIIICSILMQIQLWVQQRDMFTLTTKDIIRIIRGASTPVLHELVDCPLPLPTDITVVVLDELRNRETYRDDMEMRL